MMKLQIWPRADGMTEIEWDGDCTRFTRPAEVDAFVAGFRAAHRATRDLVRELDVEDRRAVARAPRSEA